MSSIKKSQNDAFLGLAERIGHNLLNTRFHKGYFVPSESHIYTKFDSLEPLVLLQLYALTNESQSSSLPQVWPGRSFFVSPYRLKDRVIDNSLIYTLVGVSEPPLSLQEAAAQGDVTKIEEMIKKGVDVNSRECSLKKTALHWSAMHNHMAVVEMLLSYGADVDARDSSGISSLHYAIRDGRKDIVELFLVNSTVINTRDVSGDTPLHYASRNKKVGKDLAELFITKGADVNAKNNAGQTPLDIALSENNMDIATLLVNNGAKVSSFHNAAAVGQYEQVKGFLDRGVDVNVKNDAGRKPLDMAVQGRHKDIAQLLVNKGAKTSSIWFNLRLNALLAQKDENNKDRSGETPVKKEKKMEDAPNDPNSAQSPDMTAAPNKPYVVLERSDVRAVIVNNEPVDDDVLPGHRGGYSGVASLTHRARDKNLFVPFYAGLNFEHIHDGTNQPRDILFEPRQAPMQIRQIDEHTAELYQPPTPNWQLESWLRYRLLDDGVIKISLECIPRAHTFKNDYIGLFFASYIDKPESLDIHFLGRPADDGNGEARWIRGVTPAHGILPTHLAVDDNRKFVHDPNFPLTLVFNKSNYRYTEPWYYGVSGGMAFVLMFRPGDNVRLSQSPSGAGQGNPAWDFQWFVPQYKVGQRYRFVMRAMYLPFESQEQIIRASSRHRTALTRQ